MYSTAGTVCTKKKKKINKFLYCNDLRWSTPNQSNVYAKCGMNHFILGKNIYEKKYL